jgi:hypothetical protein
MDTLCKCGHTEATHYNAKDPTTRGGRDPKLRRPCHHLGKHDTRCGCKDFRPAVLP